MTTTKAKDASAPAEPTRKLLVNSTTAGIVYDKAGHTVGGGERVPVTSLDEVGQAQVDGGYLRLLDVPSS